MVAKTHGIVLSGDYGSCYDGMLNGVPIQIKCIKKGCAIELGDFYRNSMKEEDFYLLVGFYDKLYEDKTPRIVEEYLIKVCHKKWNALFEFDYILDMKELMDTITNRYEDDLRWKRETKRLKGLWGKRLVMPRFKRDHKSQKRIQCAIGNKRLKEFLEIFNGEETKA